MSLIYCIMKDSYGGASMSWKKGQSGNPLGRPKRAFTEILVQHGDDMIIYKGDELTRKEVLGILLWQFVTAGRVEFGNVTLEVASVRDWADTVRWIYAHLDGPITETPQGEMIVTVIRGAIDDN